MVIIIIKQYSIDVVFFKIFILFSYYVPAKLPIELLITAHRHIDLIHFPIPCS